MKITNVKVKLAEGGAPRLKGYASIVLDDELAINDIKIVNARRGLCVEFPQSYKNFGFQNVAPINRQTRNYLQSAILDAYQSVLEAKVSC